MLNRVLRSPQSSKCNSITFLTTPILVRHASIRAGVARGLRASGVEPSRKRRGPNTSGPGEQNVNTRPTRFQSRGENRRVQTDEIHPRSTIPSTRQRPATASPPSRKRRGPNTGGLGQQKVNTRPTRLPSRNEARHVQTDERYSRPAIPSTRERPTTTSPASRQQSPHFPSPRRPSTTDGQTHEKSLSSRPIHPFPVPYTTATSVFVPGRRAASSILLAGRRTIHKLYIAAQSRAAVSVRQLEAEAKRRRVPVELMSQDWIDRVLATLKMDGVVNDGCLVECSEFTYTTLATLGSAEKGEYLPYFSINERETRRLERDAEGVAWRAPLLLWLHEVVDTGNIAALYRSAIYFGVDAVVLSERGTGRMQPKTLRASAGAAEFLPTFVVGDTEGFMRRSKNAGWSFLGAMPPARDPRTSKKIDVGEMKATPVERKPCVLVLGNESQGLAKEIREECDMTVSIPGAGQRALQAGVDSLNVSAAGTLLLSKLLQRGDSREEVIQPHETGVKFSQAKEKVF